MSARREFCTLFDSGYLFKALAMYESLERHCDSFHLTALCFDQEAERVLGLLALPHLSVLPLSELERADPGLVAAKSDRNRFEYCCTTTPRCHFTSCGRGRSSAKSRTSTPISSSSAILRRCSRRWETRRC